MKIIQSFWSGRHKSITNKYGWLDYQYHWLGWMLSCYQLRKYYDEVELYTDKFGYDILINKLKLPYTQVHVVLDELNELPDGLWAMAKIKVYSLQTEPFLHVDGDVFIFDPFPEKLLKSDLIAQNQEVATDYYHEMWNNISPKLEYLPKEMEDFHKGINNHAYNMGIFGGNDVEFFEYYCKNAFDFVYRNKKNWEDVNLFNFNIFYEQVLFYECVIKQNKNVESLITENIGDNDYIGFGDFEKVPFQKKYLHLIGNYKQNYLVSKKMEQYCLLNYPEFFKSLKSLIPEKYTFFDEANYHFTETENRKLIKWYENNKVDSENFSTKRLLARDLFTRFQMQKMQKLENNILQDYYITLLVEIDLKEENEKKILCRKDTDKEIYLKELNDIDSLILYEISKKPIQKNKIYDVIIQSFEESFSEEEIQKAKIIIDDFFDFLMSEKVIAFLPPKK
jgi:hypothetical protein